MITLLRLPSSTQVAQCAPGKVNKQDLFQVFQGSGIGNTEDNLTMDPRETWEAWLADFFLFSAYS